MYKGGVNSKFSVRITSKCLILSGVKPLLKSGTTYATLTPPTLLRGQVVSSSSCLLTSQDPVLSVVHSPRHLRRHWIVLLSQIRLYFLPRSVRTLPDNVGPPLLLSVFSYNRIFSVRANLNPDAICIQS